MPWKKKAQDATAAVHEHEMDVIDIQHPQRRPLEPEFTLVLFGCTGCPHVDTRRIDGRWEIEQVTRLHRDPGGVRED
ncbi:MAG: hypothetical protein FWE15_29990 [Actinomycetia bacterium]|nr:hypothetical protein [Actinomycetes bacterium]